VLHHFGHSTALREDIYRMTSFGRIESLFQDVRYACRGLRRSPGFTIVAVLTLALAIGINAAVFTVTNATLFTGFRSIDGNDRLLYIGTQNNGRGCCASYPDFLDWRSQAASFAGMGAVADLQITLADAGSAPEHYDATLISANSFGVLGQRPMLGRDFSPSDEMRGAAPVAILRYSFWERRYGGDPAILGRTVRINGTPTTIIGVMPRDFSFPQNQDLWLPLVPTPAIEKREARGLWFAFGRLADDATRAGARTELETIGRRLAAAYPQTNAGWVPQPRTFAEFFIGRDAPLIYGVIWGAAGFVLLIACANLANLMLARAIGRAREISVRVALGAGRWRIIRQLLVESLTLSALGATAGWWIASVSVHAYGLTANPPTRVSSDHLLNYAMDGRVFLYLVAIAIAAAVIFGLAPAAYLTRLDINGTLKDGSRGTAGGGRRALSRLLITGEMALAVVLLAGAGALVRSFVNLSTADLGVRTDNVTTMFLALRAERYDSSTSQIDFFDRLSSRLGATPGVESIAIASALPASSPKAVPYELDGAPPVDSQHRPTVSALTIGPSYFGTLDAAIRQGRDFNEFDGTSGTPVAIVNQQFASTYWPGEDPLGKRLRIFDGPTPGAWLRVVGVSANVVQNVIDRQAHDAVVYRPYRQHAERAMWVLVRARVPESTLAAACRREIHAIDADLPIWIGPYTLDERLAGTGDYWSIRNDAVLFVVFAAIALLLASIGLYAVVTHAVNRRTQEIGIRIAIGATARDVLALVLTQGMRPLGAGLALGLIASLAVTPLLKSQLVGVSSVDPTTLGAASIVLILAASLGCLIPALRALRVDPVIALRQD
jgi:putative ABC transport system permease protein